MGGGGGALVGGLDGERDLYNADEVRKALATSVEAQPARVVVDLGAVEFLDSTILGALVEARSTLGDGRLVLAAPGPVIRRALEVSGLDRHFAVHDSVEDALAAEL